MPGATVQLCMYLYKTRNVQLVFVCSSLSRYSKPISVARHILEHTQQSMLVGSGAKAYAEKNGFCLEDNGSLLTEETREKYQQWKDLKDVDLKEKGHDTLCE